MKNRPPKHLSRAARAWFADLVKEYSIQDSGGLALVTAAAEAWQRAGEARELIAKEGAVTKDRFGQLVAHPAVRIEQGARAQLLQAIKQLHLDIEPLRDIGRPARPLGITNANR